MLLLCLKVMSRKFMILLFVLMAVQSLLQFKIQEVSLIMSPMSLSVVIVMASPSSL